MTRRYVVITALAVATVTAVAIAIASPWAQENSATGALAVPTMPPAGDFVRMIDNPYLPLTPGKVFVYKGTKDGVTAENTVDVTHRTKTILGVQVVVVDDTASVAGEPESGRPTGTRRTSWATSGIWARTPSTW
jgi:hypothetical protein